MLEPTKQDINKQNNLYIAEVTALNVIAYTVIKEVRDFTEKNIKKLSKMSAIKRARAIKSIEEYTISKYSKKDLIFKKKLVSFYNKSSIVNRELAEKTLKRAIKWQEMHAVKQLPPTSLTKITRDLFSKKGIVSRNKKLAGRVVDILENGFKKEQSLKLITKNIDIEFGFRDARGRLNKKALSLIRKGKLSHTNGHIYNSYRIARTEVKRMWDVQVDNTFKQNPEDSKRLKLIAIIDGRTRPQSRSMNNQISRKDGKFRYPNGTYYRLGTAPAKWSINDREQSFIIYLDNKQGNT